MSSHLPQADAPSQPNPVPTRFSYRVEGNLYASEYPISRDDVHFSPKLNAMMDFGVTDFIDLTMPGELNPYAHWLRNGVQHWSFPIPDTRAPKTPAQMDAILDQMDALLAVGHVVCVHCWGGIGRTGTVVAAWLGRKYGLNAEEALQRQQARWHENPKSKLTHENVTPYQIRFLQAYLNRRNRHS